MARRMSTTRVWSERFPAAPARAEGVYGRCVSGPVDESRAAAGAGQRLAGTGWQLRCASPAPATTTKKKAKPKACKKG